MHRKDTMCRMSALKERIVKLLRSSERYTKTDMVYLASGTSYSFVGQGVGILATLGFAIAVNHLLPKEVYGTYKFVLSIVAILALFSLTGMSSAVFQAAAQGFDGALRKGFWENIRWSVGIFLGGLALAGYYFLNDNSTLAIGVLIGASLSPFIASSSLFGPFLGGKKDFYRQTLYGVLDTTLPILILIGVAFVTNDPLVLLATYFVTNAVAALFFFGRTLEVYHADQHRHDVGLLKYSKHLSAMGILSGVANNLDQVLLFHYLGATQVAIYNFAIALPEQMKGPMKNLNAMLQARFATHADDDIQRDMKNKMGWFLILSIVVVSSYVVLAPFVFRLLFPAYLESVWYSQIFALWILTLPFEPAYVYLAARRLTHELYISNIVYSIMQITTLFVGIMLWGLAGVIFARVFTRCAIGFLNYILYRRAVWREIALA
jgi:O-antigen/teichoic acid export membrane protein